MRFLAHISPNPLRGRRGKRAVRFRQAPWPCCFIILLTVVLKVLKYWTEHERWWTAQFPFSRCPFEVEDLKSHAAVAGLFRLTPRTITLVKEEEICVFTCTLNTALSLVSTSLPADYVACADQSSQYTLSDDVSFDIRGPCGRKAETERKPLSHQCTQE